MSGSSGAPRRLPSVTLSNWRGNDPRARRRFVTTLGDALRAHGAVVVEGIGPEPAAALDELLAALEAYFGLEPGRFGATTTPQTAELPGLELASLWLPAEAATVVVGALAVRPGSAVLTSGEALEVETAGILATAPVSFRGEGTVVRRTAASIALLAEFATA